MRITSPEPDMLERNGQPTTTTSPQRAVMYFNRPRAAGVLAVEHPVAIAGRLLVRYGLVVVVAWIGALKYSSYEAAAIHPLIAHSPLMSWLYHIFSVRALSATLGTAEIIAALLIALRPLWPRVSAIGSAFGILLFLGTLSFLFTTPGVSAAGGFPVLSVLPGQFLLKDVVLLGASLWTLGDSLGAARWRARSKKVSMTAAGVARSGAAPEAG
jgi:reactive chlorine resistance protein C